MALLVLNATLLSFLSSTAVGAPAPQLEAEIEHLLAYVKDSECQFIRNDKTYSSREASRHIERKYKHIKDRINTAEQFITHGASKSSVTGRSYQVRCGSEMRLTETWLTEELHRFRAAQSKLE